MSGILNKKKLTKIEIRSFIGESCKERIIGHQINDEFIFKSEKIKNECLADLKIKCKIYGLNEACLVSRDLNRDVNKDFLKYNGFLYAFFMPYIDKNNPRVILEFKNNENSSIF